MIKNIIILNFLYFIFFLPLYSTEKNNQNKTGDVYLEIETKSEVVLKGRLLEETSEYIIIVTIDELEFKILKKNITRKTIINESQVSKDSYHKDPNYSRLMFTPTARPLKAGDGYIYDYEILFPGISYGITDNIGVMTGFSILPGLGLDEQLFYIAPKIGYEFSDKLSTAGGILYATVPEEGSLGILYSVTTYGTYDAHLTIGVGFGFVNKEFSKDPIFVFGGNLRLTKSIALVSENWMHPQLSINQTPFAIAVRFFGQNIAVDAGFIIIGEVIKMGFPMPWLSFIYNF
ncbi:MAG: hypothetical protein OEZ22_05825 [Spirochaetia bacterium]|nr:hypothetical protein [Spirochaetia bacterium]